jgi:hypothetical protein
MTKIENSKGKLTAESTENAEGFLAAKRWRFFNHRLNRFHGYI